ncbi:MAG TPA: acyl-CoA dehydrogenase family protein, partial [Candidatus Poseidoniales archaeon]
MLNFNHLFMLENNLSEEQQMLKDLARDFADEEIMPYAAQWEKEGEFPQAAIRKAHDLGLLNCTIPEKYGGAGMSFLDEVIVNE